MTDGQTIDLKKRVYELVFKNLYETSEYDKSILELYQRYIALERKQVSFDVEKIKNTLCEEVLKNYSEKKYEKLYSLENAIYGLIPSKNISSKILKSVSDNYEIFFMEDVFLKSVISRFHSVPEEQLQFQYSCGFVVDDLTEYFDATRPSRMEMILNSDFKVTDEQLKRARANIKKITENKISKYNSQPIVEPKIGRDGVAKVLVIDQSYNDYSIIKGCADDSTFEKMLECAIEENPDADIIIKTHPDAIGTTAIKTKCYYQNIQEHDNIYKFTAPINPYSIIGSADKIYVCTSQFGFEALMCGKEVHTFGMPFYAGWGLSVDNQKCERRTRKRTLEEIFYIAYIYMSQYINPETCQKCEIEDAIDYLIKNRQKYFSEVEK